MRAGEHGARSAIRVIGRGLPREQTGDSPLEVGDDGESLGAMRIRLPAEHELALIRSSVGRASGSRRKRGRQRSPDRGRRGPDAGGLGQTALDAGSKVRVEHHQQQLRLRRRVPKDSSRGDVSMFGYLLGRHLGVTVLRK